MKLLIVLFSIIVSSQAFCDSAMEENIFTVLKNNGVYIDPSTNSFELKSISCSQGFGNRCYYVDSARPHEGVTLMDDSAATIYNALISAGIKPIHLFGEEGVSAEYLTCTRYVQSNEKQAFYYRCQRLAPLFP